MNSLTATVKIGLTASTKRRDGLHPLIFATVGPIISSVAQTDLIDEGNVMPVHVEQLFTGFTSRWNAKTDYTRMMTDLVKNRSRNDLLVNRLVELVDAGRHVLVLSARTEHLATLHGLLTLKRTGVGQVLTGKTPTKERKLAMARMVEGFPVTFATTQLAKEGLDAPILDALVYATPNRDDVTTQQSVGRIQRVLAGKPTPLVIDPVDNIGVLQHQASERMRVYRKVSGGAIL
jgi:superfamily II DNA or RNA helicase